MPGAPPTPHASAVLTELSTLPAISISTIVPTRRDHLWPQLLQFVQ